MWVEHYSHKIMFFNEQTFDHGGFWNNDIWAETISSGLGGDLTEFLLKVVKILSKVIQINAEGLGFIVKCLQMLFILNKLLFVLLDILCHGFVDFNKLTEDRTEIKQLSIDIVFAFLARKTLFPYFSQLFYVILLGRNDFRRRFSGGFVLIGILLSLYHK